MVIGILNILLRSHPKMTVIIKFASSSDTTSHLVTLDDKNNSRIGLQIQLWLGPRSKTNSGAKACQHIQRQNIKTNFVCCSSSKVNLSNSKKIGVCTSVPA